MMLHLITPPRLGLIARAAKIFPQPRRLGKRIMSWFKSEIDNQLQLRNELRIDADVQSNLKLSGHKVPTVQHD